MGKKKHRSRSASRERDRDKRRKRYSSNEDSNSSEDRKRSRHHKSKHKSKDKRRERSRSPERLPTAQELEDIREEERRKKEEIKKYETPEEKRARRLAKKEAKERKRKVQMGWDEEYIGYTNCDNPFGDEHLLETFVWGKKLEHEGISDVDKEQIDKMQKKKMIENKLELEKVKKRRLEREREREDRENEREMLQRNKEIEYYREWEKQEDSFHLNQARLRSKIRIEDGRAKPIDLLARYISAEDEDDVTIEMHEPYTYLNGMTVNDLEDLLEDIKVYKELEQESKNQAYWRDITIITEDELNKLRKLDPNNKDHVGERRTGINQSVSEDVASVFKGKTLQQLSILEESIKNKLKGGEGVDVGYWESLLNQLKAHMARSRLREKHQDQLRRKLFKLKQQQGIEESAPLFPIIKQLKRESRSRSGSPTVSTKPPLGGGTVTSTQHGGDAEASHSQGAARQHHVSEQGQVVGTSAKQEIAGTSAQQEVAGTSAQQEVAGTSAQQEVAETSEQQEVAGTSGVGDEGLELDDEPVLTQADLEEADPEHQCYRDYESGDYSPRLLRVEDMEIDSLVYDPREDMKRLEFARRQVIRTGQARKDADEDLLKIAKAGMNEEEASFSVMVPLEKQTMIWSDKYRPRKPRFFNRVHTGFEWNKYNQTHYDMDNPPPKIVQGYKFNIFYPDLIDKAKAPTYTITPIEGEADFAVLRFVAGPPYEDIAFKIVNREWEYSYKRGFRCQFQNNIFQLWFHFKRFRYRR